MVSRHKPALSSVISRTALAAVLAAKTGASARAANEECCPATGRKSWQRSRHLASWMAAVAVIISTACAAGAVEARPKTTSRLLADSGKRSTPKTPIPVDSETEAAALELVLQHLPELDDVLKRLRADQSRDYERAIRDLAKSARKLEAAKNRDGQLYDIEVELLKAQHHVNLLTAKLKVRDSQGDRDQLRVAVARLLQAQIARAGYDVQLLRGRLERAQQQFDAASKRLQARRTNTDTQIEKSYLNLLRRAGREPTK